MKLFQEILVATLGLVVACAMPEGGQVSRVPAQAAAGRAVVTNYYISPTGSDTNTGTSTATPWKSLAKVNSVTFAPGDSILFQCGGTWTGSLAPLGSGSSSAQITIDRYGSGAAPVINGAGATNAVQLSGQEYWTIQNLDVRNNASGLAVGVRRGISVYAKATGITHRIRILNNTVSDVYGTWIRGAAAGSNMYSNGAIDISYPGRATSANRFDEVTIDGNSIHDVWTSGIRVREDTDSVIDPHYTNVVINNNTITNTGSDGIIVANCDNPLIQNNRVYNAGAKGTTAETQIIAGLWVCSVHNATIQYNEVARTVLFSSDGTAFDTDWGCSGTIVFQYNYSHENGGGFWLDCANIILDPAYVKTVLRYNVSVNDHQYVTRNGDEPAELYNNVFYQTTTAVNANMSNGGSQHVYFNNIFCYPTSAPNWGAAVFDSNLYSGPTPPARDRRALTSIPGFVTPGTYADGIANAAGYKTAAGGPGIDQGDKPFDSLSLTGQDFWGSGLFNGYPDLGAYEGFTTSPSTATVYDFRTDASTVQGKRNWYYVEANGTTYTNLTWTAATGRWKGTGTYNLIWSPGQLHPATNDTGIGWKAPSARTVRIQSNPHKVASAGTGVNLRILKNTTSLWSGTLAGSDVTGLTQDTTVTVAAGDMLYFLVNQGTEANGDATFWQPKISY